MSLDAGQHHVDDSTLQIDVAGEQDVLVALGRIAQHDLGARGEFRPSMPNERRSRAPIGIEEIALADVHENGHLGAEVGEDALRILDPEQPALTEQELHQMRCVAPVAVGDRGHTRVVPGLGLSRPGDLDDPAECRLAQSIDVLDGAALPIDLHALGIELDAVGEAPLCTRDTHAVALVGGIDRRVVQSQATVCHERRDLRGLIPVTAGALHEDALRVVDVGRPSKPGIERLDQRRLAEARHETRHQLSDGVAHGRRSDVDPAADLHEHGVSAVVQHPTDERQVLGDVARVFRIVERQDGPLCPAGHGEDRGRMFGGLHPDVLDADRDQLVDRHPLEEEPVAHGDLAIEPLAGMNLLHYCTLHPEYRVKFDEEQSTTPLPQQHMETQTAAHAT